MDTPTTETPAAEEAQPETNYGLLAKKAYGDNYHGEAIEPVEEVEQVAEEVAEESPEAAEIPAEVEPVAEETEEVEASEEVIDSWDELVESQAWEPDWANNLKIGVKVDGEESKVSMSDLRASYQMQEAAEKRLNESKEKAKALNQVVSEKSEQLNEQFSVAAKLIADAEKMLDGEVSQVDPNLRRDDPAEWAAKNTEFDKRRQNLAKLRSDAHSEYQKAAQQHQVEQEKQRAKAVEEGQTQLLEAIPEWADQVIATADKAKLVSYLSDVGYTEQEIGYATDPRMIVMARKAMLHDARDTKVDPAKKRLKKVPKTLKSGSPKTETQTQQAQRDKLKAKLKASGKFEDALALYQLK